MKKPRLLLLLTLPFFLQVLGVTALVGWLSFRDGQQSLNRLAGQLMASVSERIVDNLTEYLARPIQINAQNQLLMQERYLTLDRLEEWESFLWRQVQVESNVNFIKITNAAGEQWTGEKLETGDRRINIIAPETNFHFHSYATDVQGQRSQLILDLEVPDTREGPWYQEPIRAKRRIWTSVFPSFLEETLLIAISDPIYPPDASEADQFGAVEKAQEHPQKPPQQAPPCLSECGPEGADRTAAEPNRIEPIGVLNTAVRLSSVGDFLRELEIGTTGQAFIVEQRPENRGVVLATSADEIPFRMEAGERVLFPMEESRDPVTQAVARQLRSRFADLGKIEQAEQFEAQVERSPLFVRLEPLMDDYGLRWLVVVVVPESDFMAQIQASQRRTVLICLGTLLVATGLSVMTAGWVARPLARLAQASRELARGNLARRVDEAQTHTAEVEQVAIAFNSMAQQLQDNFATLEQRVVERTQALQLEQQKTEELLLNILPAPIAEKLKRSPDSIAEYFEEVTILFADIVGFTPLAQELAPLDLVNLLNQIFSCFDELAEQLGLEKIKTIGDAYMVAAGLPIKRPDHARVMADMALAMQAAIAEFQSETRRAFQIRIGINSGVVVAGVIGSKKFIYDLWGDAVNVAARMESHGEAGRIQVTASTYEQLKGAYELQYRGIVEIKGKGAMETYWLLGKKVVSRPVVASVPS